MDPSNTIHLVTICYNVRGNLGGGGGGWQGRFWEIFVREGHAPKFRKYWGGGHAPLIAKYMVPTLGGRGKNRKLFRGSPRDGFNGGAPYHWPVTSELVPPHQFGYGGGKNLGAKHPNFDAEGAILENFGQIIEILIKENVFLRPFIAKFSPPAKGIFKSLFTVTKLHVFDGLILKKFSPPAGHFLLFYFYLRIVLYVLRLIIQCAVLTFLLHFC